MRKKSGWCLALSLITAILSVAIPFREFSLSMQGAGIIGGSDFPTIQFFIARFAFGGYFVLLHIALAAALISLIIMLFPDAVKEGCTIKTSAFSLCLSAVTGLGLFCVLDVLSIVFLSHPDDHPVRYPASIIAGIILLLVFAALIVFYILQRKKAPSKKGVVIDIACALISVIPFLWIAMWVQQIIIG